MPSLNPTLLCQCLLDRRVERAQTGGEIRPEMDPEGPAMALRQDLKVPARLRGLDETKRVLLSRDLQIPSSQVTCRNTPLLGPPLYA